MRAANDLGRTKTALLRLAVKAHDRNEKSAEQFYAAGSRRKVKNLLHKASRKMVSFNYRVRSLVATNQISAETAIVLGGIGEPILEDMRILLGTL